MGIKTLAALAAVAMIATATATPASAATDPPSATTELPPLNPAHLRAAIDGLPNADVSGAILQVRGVEGSWEGTSGVADIHSGRPVPQHGRFRVGSITKTFTAAAVLHLAGKGRVDLNRTVQSYLPDLLPAEYEPITIRQLLNYTSGLPGIDIDHKDPAWFLKHRFDTWTPLQLVDLAIQGKPMLFAPGTRQDYGNITYLVAGLVIEKVTGRPYGETVRDAVIRPLRLHATTVPGADRHIHGPHARGYEAVTVDGRTTYVDITEANPTFQWAAAEIISNAPDLDRFFAALISGRLLPPAQTAELFAIPDVMAYDGDDNPANDVPAHFSGGIARFELNGIEFWGKTGDRPGYNTGAGATRNLSRRLVFSLNTLHMGGEQPAMARQILAAAAGLG